jgi:hypothetical protein
MKRPILLVDISQLQELLIGVKDEVYQDPVNIYYLPRTSMLNKFLRYLRPKNIYLCGLPLRSYATGIQTCCG